MEIDPATQSTTQTDAIARENLPRRLAVHMCENVPIIYLLPLRPTEQLERLGHPKNIARLLLQVPIEVAIYRDLHDEIR